MKREKVLVIFNAITNGGDWLVLNSGLRLLDRFLGKENYTYINVNGIDVASLPLAQYDIIFFVGGPQITNRLIEGIICSVVSKVKKERKKFFLLGCSWYGNSDDSEKLYSYEFSDKAKETLSYINENGILGCRDYSTVNLLKSKCYKNVIMTGCPVWYGNLDGTVKKREEIERIIISDIGISKNSEYHAQQIKQFESVLGMIKKKFPKQEKVFTFNNGIDTQYSSQFNKNIQKILEKEKIEYFDLSCGKEKFTIYNDCDFHIGYRVHSHIYSLTQGMPSVLICEDARGMGMNRTLGFPVLCANSSRTEGKYESNRFLLEELENEIDRMLENRDYEMERVRFMFRHYFDTMVSRFFNKVQELC